MTGEILNAFNSNYGPLAGEYIAHYDVWYVLHELQKKQSDFLLGVYTNYRVRLGQSL